MSIRRLSPKYLCVCLFPAVLMSAITLTGMCRAAVPKTLDRSQALVTIRSVNAVGGAGDRAGGLSGVAVFLAEQDPGRIMKLSRSGSGVIIDPRGIIVTNAHLVRNAAGISVELFDGNRLEGRLIDVIPNLDIAFLSVKSRFPLAHLPIADSDHLIPGSRVYCIGHALDHNGALFGGDVSAVLKRLTAQGARPIFLRVRFGFHLYGGDSGSPILDRDGYLVGIVSAGRRSGDMATLAVASNVIRDAYWNIPKC